MRERYTYKSSMGDYGSAIDWDDRWQEIYALRNKLGEFEDNDWRSVKEDGNPEKYGLYVVTVENKENGKRYVTSSTYMPLTLYGFDINKSEEYKVVAWKDNIPYDGE